MGVIKLPNRSFTYFALVLMKISSGVHQALPMGVAPEAIAKIFGYRLKKIAKYIRCTSSCINCRLLSLTQCIPFLRMS
jgi:hypothetical protein